MQKEYSTTGYYGCDFVSKRNVVMNTINDLNVLFKG